MSVPELLLGGRRTPLLLGLGALLAAVAAVAAPTSPLLPAPDTAGQTLLAAGVLAVVFAVGYLFPLPSLLALVPVIVLEGAVRRWIVNDIAVFMLKDFFVLGIYAATIPRLRRTELRRPLWLLAPLTALLTLAVLHLPLTDDRQQALIGFRSYVFYVPLLWVAPKLLRTTRHALIVFWTVLVLAAAQSALSAVQTLTGNDFLNRLTLNTVPALITYNGISYLRPTGTFLQVGTLAAFLIFAVIAVLAVVASAPHGRMLWATLLCAVPITWGVVLGSSRALTWTTTVGVAGFLVLTLVQRRWLPALALVAACTAGWFTLQHLPVGGGSTFTKNIEITYLDRSGKIITQSISIGTGDASAVRGFVEKGARRDATDKVGGGVPHNRFREQWSIVGQPRLVGHGTGSMTLGSSYVLPNKQGVLAGEGMFSKLTWELGSAGLVVFCLLLAAFFYATARAAWRARGHERTIALVAAGAAALVPMWFVLTFALDYPVVGALYYTFVGYAIARHPESSG